MVYFTCDVVDKKKWDFSFVLASIWPLIRQHALDANLGDQWPEVKELHLTGVQKFSLGPKSLLDAIGGNQITGNATCSYDAAAIQTVGSIIFYLQRLTLLFKAGRCC